MKNINLRKVIAMLLSLLMVVGCFTTSVFALGSDVDINIGDSGNSSTKIVLGSKLIENGLALYEGAAVSGSTITLNEDGAFVEFNIEGRETVKANFTVNANEAVTFALYLSGIKVKDITLTSGTGEVVLASELVTGKYNFKLERTSPATAGSVAINYISVVGGTVLEMPKGTAGDVNGSETIDLDDVVLLAQYVAGWQVELNLDVANVNGEGEIDLDDVVLLAQYVAGWDVTLSGGSAVSYPAQEVTMKEVLADLKLTSRADIDDSDKLRLDWSYSGFVMQGDLGGDIVLTDVVIWQDNLFYCVVDNNYANKQEVILTGTGNIGDVTIVKGLNPGFHTIQFFKASEAYSVQVSGMKFNGTLSTPPAAKEKTIQFIGDSVTCGSGLYNNSDAIHRSDISKSFGMITARYFDAEFRVQSLSGSMFSYDESKASSYMYDRYLDKFVSDTNSVYDFSKETQPDVVVVALGTNDHAMDTTKVDEYVNKMLTMVREKHPNAKIVWFYGMMNGSLDTYIRDAVASFNETDGNTYYLKGSLNDCSGYNGHPTPESHEIGASELINFIEANEIL